MKFRLIIVFSFLLISNADASGGWYSIVDQECGFHLISETRNNDNHLISRTDLNGQKYTVHKDMLFGNKDIALIHIEDTKADMPFYKVSLHFNESSWDKIRQLTDQYIGSKLAFLKTDRVISSPRIEEALNEVVQVWFKDKREFYFFKEGLQPANEPNLKQRKVSYVKFLEKWAIAHPKDNHAKRSLADHLADSDVLECNRAENIYREINKNMTPAELGACYFQAHNFQKAVESYKKAPDSLETRLLLADAYDSNGQPGLGLALMEESVNAIDGQTESVARGDRVGIFNDIRRKHDSLKTKLKR